MFQAAGQYLPLSLHFGIPKNLPNETPFIGNNLFTWLNMRALILGLLLASQLCLGADGVHEIGLPATIIEVVELKYFIEPQDVPRDIQKFKQFQAWKTTSKARHLTSVDVEDKRIVMSFDLRTLYAQSVYFHYPWVAPLNFAQFMIVDEQGQELDMTIVREKSPIWEAYLPKGQHRVFFIAEPKVFSNAAIFLRVMNPAYMVGPHQAEHQIKIFIYGIGISFIFFNLCMFLLHRRFYFIYYVGYSSSLLYLLATGSSHALYPNAVLWSLSLALNVLMATLMSASVLRLKEFHPLLLRRSLLFVALTGLSFGFYYLFDINDFRYAAYVFSVAVYLLCVYGAFRRVLAGYFPAIFFALGWTVLLIGYVLNGIGLFVLQMPSLTWSAYIAYALESMLFAVGVAYRARESERRIIRAKLHALSQLQKVVYPHQMEQIKAGTELEETMPTGPGHACVLSFDIINSSKIRHINSKAFFRNVFTRCNAIMSEGYDGQNLKANAYRIKEMGDGFLCSVGYPFSSLSSNPANASVEIAMRFVQVLTEEAESLHSPTPIACGIGVALDSLSGFYPETGTKEYDIYGQALILAKRYEAMRKTIFDADMGRSVLIIQELVFMSLDPAHRQGFVLLDLKERGLSVRDDPAAVVLYYKFLDQQTSGEGRPDTTQASDVKTLTAAS